MVMKVAMVVRVGMEPVTSRIMQVLIKFQSFWNFCGLGLRKKGISSAYWNLSFLRSTWLTGIIWTHSKKAFPTETPPLKVYITFRPYLDVHRAPYMLPLWSCEEHCLVGSQIPCLDPFPSFPVWNIFPDCATQPSASQMSSFKSSHQTVQEATAGMLTRALQMWFWGSTHNSQWLTSSCFPKIIHSMDWYQTPTFYPTLEQHLFQCVALNWNVVMNLYGHKSEAQRQSQYYPGLPQSLGGWSFISFSRVHRNLCLDCHPEVCVLKICSLTSVTEKWLYFSGRK